MPQKHRREKVSVVPNDVRTCRMGEKARVRCASYGGGDCGFRRAFLHGRANALKDQPCYRRSRLALFCADTREGVRQMCGWEPAEEVRSEEARGRKAQGERVQECKSGAKGRSGERAQGCKRAVRKAEENRRKVEENHRSATRFPGFLPASDSLSSLFKRGVSFELRFCRNARTCLLGRAQKAIPCCRTSALFLHFGAKEKRLHFSGSHMSCLSPLLWGERSNAYLQAMPSPTLPIPTFGGREERDLCKPDCFVSACLSPTLGGCERQRLHSSGGWI